MPPFSSCVEHNSSCFPFTVFCRSRPSPPPSTNESQRQPSPAIRTPNAASPMHFFLLAKSRRRRKIRAKLEEVAKIVSSPRIEEDHALALFSETHCAIITDAGEIIVTKNGSVRPFEAIAPKIRSIRASARSLAHFLGDLPTDVVHIRGQSAMMHAYTVGSHNLVALTEVSPGARNLDAVIARVDKCLCVNVDADGHTFIQQLADMLEEF